MTSDLQVLRETLELAMASELGFGELFYQKLFQREPALRSLFQRNSPGAQSKMFAQKLTAIVDHLDQPGWLDDELPALAGSHRAYGVTPAMYAPVGEALLATLRELCGEAFDEHAEQAWSGAYQALTRAMTAAPER